MKKRLKNPQEAAKYRNALLTQQNNIDPITKELITDAVLDHQHFGDQLCRAVLDRTVNSFEGKVQNSYNRYIKHLTSRTLSEILRNLADYLEQDYTANAIHHTAIDTDVRAFKSLSAEKQKEILEGISVQPKSNSVERSKQARKAIREGTLNALEIYKRKN
jgi:hypothetical protein